MCFGSSGGDCIFSGYWQIPLLSAHSGCRDQEARQPRPLLCLYWREVGKLPLSVAQSFPSPPHLHLKSSPPDLPSHRCLEEKILTCCSLSFPI